ncbi:hypothetical protein Syun_024705 [Stephania yunnanensis]|uniref:starch synthase n=1 Tax=Stephania yunnanensis TaxID=152371 RepID=A0AAP0EQ83_9MAGN
MGFASMNLVTKSALLLKLPQTTDTTYKSRLRVPLHSYFPRTLQALANPTSSPLCAEESVGLKPTLKDINWPSPNDDIPFWKKEFPPWDAGSEHNDEIKEKDADLMHVIHVTAEMAPVAKVGGLGDVVTGLSRACVSRGHKVEIMLPFYECIQKKQINDLKLLTSYNSYFDGSWLSVNAYQGTVSGISVILIEPQNHFFKGPSVYGGSYNELEAYLFFSRACLEWMQVTGSQPDIIHVHEWQTGGLPLLYWDMYHSLSLKKPRLILTIHNLEHYGECSKEQLSKCGLDGSLYGTIEKAVDDRTIGHNPERLSLLKGGIVYSNAIVCITGGSLGAQEQLQPKLVQKQLGWGPVGGPRYAIS